MIYISIDNTKNRIADDKNIFKKHYDQFGFEIKKIKEKQINF